MGAGEEIVGETMIPFLLFFSAAPALLGPPETSIQQSQDSENRPPFPKVQALPCLGWLFGYDVTAMVHMDDGHAIRVESLDQEGFDAFPFPGAGGESGEAGMIAVYGQTGSWLLIRKHGHFGWIDLKPLSASKEVRFTSVEREIDELSSDVNHPTENGWSFERRVLVLLPGSYLVHEEPKTDSPHHDAPFTHLGTRRWQSADDWNAPFPKLERTVLVNEASPARNPFIKVLKRQGDWLLVSFPDRPVWKVRTPEGHDPTMGDGLIIHWNPTPSGWIRWKTPSDLGISSRDFGKY